MSLSTESCYSSWVPLTDSTDSMAWCNRSLFSYSLWGLAVWDQGASTVRAPAVRADLSAHRRGHLLGLHSSYDGERPPLLPLSRQDQSVRAGCYSLTASFNSITLKTLCESESHWGECQHMNFRGTQFNYVAHGIIRTENKMKDSKT